MVKLLIGFITLLVGIVIAADLASTASAGQILVGPKADIAAIRLAVARMPNFHLLDAHVVGDYALTYIGDAHVGGPTVYKRVSGEKWKMVKVSGGGGPMFLSSMLKSGIPRDTVLQHCSGLGDIVHRASNISSTTSLNA